MKSASASPPHLLWFDLTRDRSAELLVAQFRPTCDCRIAKVAALSELDVDGTRQPNMICIHYDRPDMPGLNLLLEIKRKASSIPIAMFTVQHSEELAVWAMRSRVWEYIVLPLSNKEKQRFLHALEQLCELRRSIQPSGNKTQVEHGPALPDSIRLTNEHHKHQALNDVLLYIDQHFRSEIDQKALAKRCGMTAFRFSRLFKEVNGLGFMEYLLSKRMDCAKELLINSQMPITSIGYGVGFKDPSYFARAFKQLVGCTPSEYRQAQHADAATASPFTEDLSEVVESLQQLANR
ncbi:MULTISPECIES: response regulator transcription factor [Pseudomonas]|uniref:Response regulator transcription factor n=1 Tax=Pseudomonas carassii TaxID=3115855 RepID=A0ABU7H6V4_9PSED|nr:MULTISPECIES: response regulator transcription factor [unclassified Pseudomonas]MBC3438636.1 response regulator transcription factor [Pseudomonas sp. BW16M2]MEE1887053.1 response regulator transcription factor [Pseudomonas sp. 137P]